MRAVVNGSAGYVRMLAYISGKTGIVPTILFGESAASPYFIRR
jgi:hypothetical protein